MGFYTSFVVKIWVDDDGRMKRGYIQHVGTQESMYFPTMDRMHAFMMQHLDPQLHDLAEVDGIPSTDVSIQHRESDNEKV